MGSPWRAVGPGVACADDCIAVEDSGADLDSEDGESPGFEGFIGSVPEVITRDSENILYNPGKMRADDLKSGTIRGATVSTPTNGGEPVSYVDPSAWIDAQDRIVLFSEFDWYLGWPRPSFRARPKGTRLSGRSRRVARP